MVAALGGWLFRHRTSLPLPIVAVLLFLPAGSSPSLTTLLEGMGVLIVATGELLRMWAVHHIGVVSRTRSERLGPLVQTGPFALVRNPLYLGNILLWLGFTVSAGLLWLAPIVVAFVLFEYHAIVRWEERLLESRLGEAYREYVQRVPRWIPKVQPAGHTSATAFSWGATFYSERGTLIAIAVGYLLLWAKERG